MTETAVVTGGAGFIGSHIVQGLLEKGFQVKVLDLASAGKKNLQPWLKDIEFIEGDVRDLALLQKTFQNTDFVLHQAALASVFRSVEQPEQYNEVNITGTLNVLEAAKANNVKRVVFASSSSVYGNPEQFPVKESFLPQPLSPYALTKLAGEHYLRVFHHLYGLETVALRYFNVFGPGQDPNAAYAAVIPKFITLLLEDEQPIIYGDGRQSRDFVFVKDVVAANLAALRADKKACGQAFNIAHGQTISLLDLVEKINKLLGKNIEPRFEPVRAGDVRKSMADVKKAEELLDFKCQYSFDEGLKQTLDWFKNQK